MDIILIGYSNIFLKEIFSSVDSELVKRPNNPLLCGMPSGHSQILTYILLKYTLPLPIQMYLILKITERYKKKHHTIFQLFIGMIFGIIFFIII